MENNISHNVWPFWIQCHAFWSYKCPYKFLTHGELHIQRIPRWFHGHLLGWHLDILKKPKGTWKTCTSCSQQILRKKVMC
jgi:hypothetical protein